MRRTISRLILKWPCIVCVLWFFSCAEKKKEVQYGLVLDTEKGRALYDQYCASCHIAPAIADLPKNLWQETVLPEMGARMGIRDSLKRDMKGISLRDQYLASQKGVFPLRPTIPAEDWKLLKAYIIALAPDTLIGAPSPKHSKSITQFDPQPITMDSTKFALTTSLKFDDARQRLILGDMQGYLLDYDIAEAKITKRIRYSSPITDCTVHDGKTFITSVGRMDPSEIASGGLQYDDKSVTLTVQDSLHRPVNTLVHDFDNDGQQEFIISEFGYFTGKLSMVTRKNGSYHKQILLNQPGAIRAVAKDMNGDNKDDIVALISQGDEHIAIFYQEENLSFRYEKAVRCNPIYGSSWFELMDFDSDGHIDIIISNGDNGDKTYLPKPYHGIRIYRNDGNNNFTENYFYPLNGATRSVSEDFDADGDVDIAVIANFPDYENYPKYSFVYLENIDAKNFKFEPYTFDESELGRWFLMDSGDVDGDGDKDLILSSFSYSFSPVPKERQKLWEKEKAHLMLLENKLID